MDPKTIRERKKTCSEAERKNRGANQIPAAKAAVTGTSGFRITLWMLLSSVLQMNHAFQMERLWKLVN